MDNSTFCSVRAYYCENQKTVEYEDDVKVINKCI